MNECLTLADPEPEDVAPAEVVGGEMSLLDPEVDGARGGVALAGVGCAVTGVETLGNRYMARK